MTNTNAVVEYKLAIDIYKKLFIVYVQVNWRRIVKVFGLSVFQHGYE